MSRYVGNADECPHCRMQYGKFRSGYSYYEVFELMKDYSPDPADWKYKRRGTVLGKWHQIKREAWKRHIEVECDSHPLNVAALQEVPF